jgi:hypothetical protein
MIVAATFAVSHTHPSLLPSWIAAVTGTFGATLAGALGWLFRHSNQAQAEAMTKLTESYLKGTELLLQQQQKQFEQFIRDYFRAQSEPR